MEINSAIVISEEGGIGHNLRVLSSIESREEGKGDDKRQDTNCQERVVQFSYMLVQLLMDDTGSPESGSKVATRIYNVETDPTTKLTPGIKRRCNTMTPTTVDCMRRSLEQRRKRYLEGNKVVLTRTSSEG
jgi:hypothetical protein